MAKNEMKKRGVEIQEIEGNGRSKEFNIVVPKFLVQLPNKFQNCLKSQLRRFEKVGGQLSLRSSDSRRAKGEYIFSNAELEKQLQAWRENPSWVGRSSQIKVSVPKGSLCNLSVSVDVGLPPDAVYNIVIDPDNKRVFKNIEEVISRKVLVDEGHRQVVDLDQAAIWKFLWWSGTISVHVLVEQNRLDHSMKFKQLNTGFMKKFEGCWRVEPLFVDEKLCFPFKPKTWSEYCSCTGGKGRLGSRVSLDQLIQPAIIPPPPISWYLRGITSKTTEMLIHDLLVETARIRGDLGPGNSQKALKSSRDVFDEVDSITDIKKRWALRRRNSKRSLIAN